MEKRWSLKRGDFAAVGRWRKEFRTFMNEHLPADMVAHELVFGELVTNAVRYGEDPMSAAVTIRDGMTRIDVESGGPGFDLYECLARTPTANGGRGLHIVKNLSESLSAGHKQGDSFCVTATLKL